MATTMKKIVQGVTLPSTVGQLGSYSVPSNTTTEVREIVLCNTHTSAVGVKLYLVENGGSPGVSNQIFDYNGSDGLVLAPSETQTWNIEEIMTAGGEIHGVASVAGVVSVRISGIERTGT